MKQINFRFRSGLDQYLLTPNIDPLLTLTEATLEQTVPDTLPSAVLPIAALGTIFAAAVSAGLLLCIACFNGYPTVFSDTGSYLVTGVFHVALSPFRAPGYAAFTRVASVGRSAWFIVVAQAVLVVYVLRESCDFLIGGGRKFVDQCLLAIVFALTALSSLPWFASLLMPDIFAAILFPCAFLLAFNPELPRIRRIVLAAILAVSVAAHTSLFPIAALSFAGLFVVRVVARAPEPLPSARPVLAWLLVPVLAAGLWTANQNQEMGLRFTISPSGNSFLLGRLFGDGLAPAFLRANCPKLRLISCRYLSDLPRDEVDFLFRHPLLRDLKGHEREIQTILRGTLAAYPVRFAISSFKQTVRQLAATHTGDEIRFYSAQSWNDDAIRRVFPGELQTFRSTRQIRGQLLPLATVASAVDTAVFWMSIAACLVFARTRRFPRIDKFFAAAIVFLVINAAVCGALSGVYNRYESRVAWLVPFCLTAYVCSWIAERKRRFAREDLISA
ncbi:MAG TPA: hypothetical protein VKT71_04615 [Candidatus Acidoferrales bacterium]|nr:hypothetical protein [Candidatus Acidoferrales bacterium]